LGLAPFALRGLGLGLAIAAPVGPIGVLCIRRTLTDGRLIGFFTGLGAATADSFYGALAAFGISAASSFLLGAQLWIHLFGAVFIAWIGVRAFLIKPATMTSTTTGEPTPRRTRLAARLPLAWLTTFGLTLTNPTTIISFAAVFAGIGLVSAHAPIPVASATVVGVFCGSALWWLVLSSGVGLFRSRLTSNGLRWINRLSGLVMLGFAVYALVTL
jgi:threonine/homoserine/homoserine lactone efflux protein